MHLSIRIFVFSQQIIKGKYFKWYVPIVMVIRSDLHSTFNERIINQTFYFFIFDHGLRRGRTPPLFKIRGGGRVSLVLPGSYVTGCTMWRLVVVWRYEIFTGERFICSNVKSMHVLYVVVKVIQFASKKFYLSSA